MVDLGGESEQRGRTVSWPDVCFKACSAATGGPERRQTDQGGSCQEMEGKKSVDSRWLYRWKLDGGLDVGEGCGSRVRGASPAYGLGN